MVAFKVWTAGTWLSRCSAAWLVFTFTEQPPRQACRVPRSLYMAAKWCAGYETLYSTTYAVWLQTGTAHTTVNNSEIVLLAPASIKSVCGTYIGSGIRFQMTYKIEIQISAATRLFLPVRGPRVRQRNTTMHTYALHVRWQASKCKEREYYFERRSCNFGL